MRNVCITPGADPDAPTFHVVTSAIGVGCRSTTGNVVTQGDDISAGDPDGAAGDSVVPICTDDATEPCGSAAGLALLLIAGTVTGCDQGTKWAAVGNLTQVFKSVDGTAFGFTDQVSRFPWLRQGAVEHFRRSEPEGGLAGPANAPRKRSQLEKDNAAESRNPEKPRGHEPYRSAWPGLDPAGDSDETTRLVPDPRSRRRSELSPDDDRGRGCRSVQKEGRRSRRDATCEDHRCNSLLVDDDAACDGAALGCPDNLAAVACTNAGDQPAPVCPVDCTVGPCDPAYVCVGTVCELRAGIGDPCSPGVGACEPNTKCGIAAAVCCADPGPDCCDSYDDCAGGGFCDFGSASCVKQNE